MKRAVYFLPLALAVVFVGIFALYMQQINEGKDIKALETARAGKTMPEFQLPALKDANAQFTREDIIGQPTLLNVWATWCPSCKVEHPYLMKLAKEKGVRIIGLNYKDDRQSALSWLKKYDNPYQFNIFDKDGKLGFDLGVYGAPETYIINAQGIILDRHVGVVDEKVWEQKIKPLLEGNAG